MRVPGRRRCKPGPHSLDHIPSHSERRSLWQKRNNKRKFRPSKQDQPLANSASGIFLNKKMAVPKGLRHARDYTNLQSLALVGR